jgi:2Fe-2S ferredoxin
MGGVNPYIKKPEAELPTEKFKVTFHNMETKEVTEFEVDPAALPYGRTGLPGSLLDIGLSGAGVDIEHSCGGVCACSTCHVIVRQGLGSCSEATEDEEDMIDTARGVETESRLACQCVPNGTQDLVVEIPAWNKNIVKEGH